MQSKTLVGDKLKRQNTTLLVYPVAGDHPQHYLQIMMKNLMSSSGWGMLLFCSAPERCRALCHSWVLRNTRTSLGSKGTSELHSSSLGRGGWERREGKRGGVDGKGGGFKCLLLFMLFSPKYVNVSR